jgi:hypothetical protein
MAPGGLSHKFGITQDEHSCRDCLDAVNIMLAVRHRSASSQLPDGRAQAGAAYQVSMHLVAVLAALLGSWSARAVPYRVGALNFSGARIKRSAHVV